MKRRVRAFFWVCMTVVLSVAGLNGLTKLTNCGNAYPKNAEFIEKDSAYDVLFFGNSHMANTVFPMELWDDYGMASYNLAGFGSPIPSTYWILKNALKEKDPKLVVVDCYGVERENKAARLQHAQMDHLPLSLDKIRMISDVVEKPEDWLEFILPFAVYHDRWWDLDQGDFEKEINVQKGAEIAFQINSPRDTAERPSKTVAMESVGGTYLRRIIEECRERKIDVLLTYLPFPADEEEWQSALYAEQIAQEYGVPYINFLDLSVIDLAVDCSDGISHLNGSGGRKVTAYLGQYMREHYDIRDHRGEEAYCEWDDDYKRYTDYKIDNMRKEESLDRFLVMLADPAFDCCIYVDGKADIRQWSELSLPLIENLAGGKTHRLMEAADRGSDYMLIVDNEGGGVFECVDHEGLSAETSFGTVSYENDGEEKILLLQGSDNDYLLETPQGDAVAVQVVAINRRDGSVAAIKRFDGGLSLYAGPEE